jgi:hypothetical protein
VPAIAAASPALQLPSLLASLLLLPPLLLLLLLFLLLLLLPGMLGCLSMCVYDSWHAASSCAASPSSSLS